MREHHGVVAPREVHGTALPAPPPRHHRRPRYSHARLEALTPPAGPLRSRPRTPPPSVPQPLPLQPRARSKPRHSGTAAGDAGHHSDAGPQGAACHRPRRAGAPPAAAEPASPPSLPSTLRALSEQWRCPPATSAAEASRTATQLQREPDQPRPGPAQTLLGLPAPTRPGSAGVAPTCLFRRPSPLPTERRVPHQEPPPPPSPSLATRSPCPSLPLGAARPDAHPPGLPYAPRARTGRPFTTCEPPVTPRCPGHRDHEGHRWH